MPVGLKLSRTFPASGAADVDPATAEIRVTFDHAMAKGSWSWVQTSKETFPESAGDVHYWDDGKTCVMPVKLEPGTKYVIWLNTNKYQNFKDTEGRAAEPHMLYIHNSPVSGGVLYFRHHVEESDDAKHRYLGSCDSPVSVDCSAGFGRASKSRESRARQRRCRSRSEA